MAYRTVVHWNAMVDGYVKCGDLELEGARKLFEEMPESTPVVYTSLIVGYSHAGYKGAARSLFGKLEYCNLFIWTMIRGYARNGHPGEALRIFSEFQKQDICPDEHSLLLVLCQHAPNWVTSHGKLDSRLHLDLPNRYEQYPCWLVSLT
uniref:Pentatricopeptide repeat-containing protein n=1 Tax=Oryza brachyantha TaxID=4533 RepID=J3LXP8_ORYBR